MGHLKQNSAELFLTATRCGSGPHCTLEGAPLPSPQCNRRTLPSSHSPSLPTLSLPLPPTPLALSALLREGAAQAGVGNGVLDSKSGGGGLSKRQLGEDAHEQNGPDFIIENVARNCLYHFFGPPKCSILLWERQFCQIVPVSRVYTHIWGDNDVTGFHAVLAARILPYFLQDLLVELHPKNRWK